MPVFIPCPPAGLWMGAASPVRNTRPTRYSATLRSLPATGRRIEFPLCGVYTFDADDRLAGEKIYYDRGTVLRQLGIFHEPQTVLGQISTLATHPVTIARAFARKLLRK